MARILNKLIIFILLTSMMSFLGTSAFAEDDEDEAVMAPQEITTHTEKGPEGDIVTKVTQEKKGEEYIIKVQVTKKGKTTETVYRFDSPDFTIEVPITIGIPQQVDVSKHPDVNIVKFTQELDMARQAMLRTDYVTALKHVNSALLIDENNPQAHMMKGSVYYAMGKYELANEEYDIVLKVDPENPEVMQFKKYMQEKTSQREKINVDSAE